MFGDRLKELRKINNVSQTELGEFLGLTGNAIYSWEKGISRPDSDTIVKIAKYFNVSTDYLLGLNEDDYDKIQQLKIALIDAGVNDIEQAMKILDILKEKKR